MYRQIREKRSEKRVSGTGEIPVQLYRGEADSKVGAFGRRMFGSIAQRLHIKHISMSEYDRKPLSYRNVLPRASMRNIPLRFQIIGFLIP